MSPDLLAAIALVTYLVTAGVITGLLKASIREERELDAERKRILDKHERAARDALAPDTGLVSVADRRPGLSDLSQAQAFVWGLDRIERSRPHQRTLENIRAIAEDN